MHDSPKRSGNNGGHAISTNHLNVFGMCVWTTMTVILFCGLSLTEKVVFLPNDWKIRYHNLKLSCSARASTNSDFFQMEATVAYVAWGLSENGIIREKLHNVDENAPQMTTNLRIWPCKRSGAVCAASSWSIAMSYANTLVGRTSGSAPPDPGSKSSGIKTAKATAKLKQDTWNTIASVDN